MCVTGNKAIDTTLVIAATVAVSVIYPPAGIGMYALYGAASGAALAGAQGRDPLQGAIIGGITGGITGGLTPPGADGSLGIVAQKAAEQAASDSFAASVGVAISSATTDVFAQQAIGQIAIGTVAAGVLGGLMPGAPSTVGYSPISQVVQNSQNIATTGSGGRQAAGSLASAIKRSKKRKLTQSDVGDLSIDTGSFANTGLQLA